MRPQENSYGDYYTNYISLVDENDLFSALANSANRSLSFWSKLSEEQGNYRYAEGKWSIKELLQHIIDTERIFSYRALAFARSETIAIPSYDENKYAHNCHADSRTLQSLSDELNGLRKSTIQLFQSFSNKALDLVGSASNSPLSPRAAGYILVGHEIHHINVVKDKYLK